MIEVVRFPREQVASEAAHHIAKTIAQLLQTGPTLCLLSGGSVGKEVVPELVKQLHDSDQLGNLHIGLIDERFGEVGHENSNATLLEKAGLTHLTHHGAHFYPVLHERFSTSIEAAHAYAIQLQNLLTGCDNRTVGVFGIGSDGHTAGIKPLASGEFARLYVLDVLVVGYTANDFSRITITPDCITQLKSCFVYAADVEKHAVIDRLLSSREESVSVFPAGILRKTSTTLFTIENK